MDPGQRHRLALRQGPRAASRAPPRLEDRLAGLVRQLDGCALDRADLPGLRVLVKLYDEVGRGEFVRAGELRLWMDTYGLTPKGQQDRRWKPPEEPASRNEVLTPTVYGHLRAVDPQPPHHESER